MKLTSKLLEEMIREAFEAPQESHWYMPKKKKEEKPDDDPEPAPEDEVKSDIPFQEEKIIAEEYRAVVSESMGSDHATQLQFLLQDAGEEEFQYVLDSLVTPDPDTEEPSNVFREGNTEARIEMRDDKIRVTVLIPDPDEPGKMEWNGSEDFDKTPKGLIQALEYAKKRLFDSKPIWDAIQQVVRKWDQPNLRTRVEYFVQKNAIGGINQYWAIERGFSEEGVFSVWAIDAGEKFEIRDAGGNAVMEVNTAEEVAGMVNKYMSEKFGKLENKESLNQIIDEEISAVFSEADVYVPPGWEQDKEVAKAAKAAWEEKRAMMGDEAFDELMATMGGLGDNLGASLGVFPEVDPEAKEKTFGTPSSTYGPVPWKWLASKPMFDDNMMWFPTRKNIRDDLMPFLQHMNALMQKYPKTPEGSTPGTKGGRMIDAANNPEANLDVKNLIIASNKENRQAWGLINHIGELIQSLRATAYGASRSKEEKWKKRAVLFTKLSNYLSDINLWINDHQQKWKYFETAYEEEIVKKQTGGVSKKGLPSPKHEPLPGADFHLNEDELNQILDEEIAGVIGEADVYVPHGYEDYLNIELDPKDLENIKKLDPKQRMQFGVYPEVDPEAEEATFGVMSGEHSDVDWESIRRNMPFGDGRLRGDGDLSELENWIVMMLKLAFKYPIDGGVEAEVHGDSERMDFEVRNLVVRGKEDQETAALVWDEVEDLKDYYIFPILEKFRISYKEPEDIKLMKKFETYNKALHRISEWSAVQGDMYDEYLKSYEEMIQKLNSKPDRKKFAKPPPEPVGQRIPIREEEEDPCADYLGIRLLLDGGQFEMAYDLLEPLKDNMPVICVKKLSLKAFMLIEGVRHKDPTNPKWTELRGKFTNLASSVGREESLNENEEEEPCETFRKLESFFDKAKGIEAFSQGYELLKAMVVGNDGKYSPPDKCKHIADAVIFQAKYEAYLAGVFAKGGENIKAWEVLEGKFKKLWGEDVPSWVGTF